MKKDLIYIPEEISIKCFGCNEMYKLYTIQKIGLDFCGQCKPNNKLVELTTTLNVLKQVISFAEKENKKINDRLVVDIANLVEELQQK